MLLESLLAVVLANSWETRSPGPATGSVAAAAEGRRVYAAAGSIFRSDDGGETWRKLFDPPYADYFTELFADPNDPDRVFASSLHAGFAYFTARLYRSDDGGETWTNSLAILNATSCSVAISGDTVYVSFSGFDSPFFRSDDGGATFFGVRAPFSSANLAIDLDGSLLASTAGTVLRSRDGGASWIDAFVSPVPCTVTEVVVAKGSYFALCESVFRSKDGGVTWIPAADTGGPVSYLVIDPQRPSLIYAATTSEDPRSNPARVLVSDDDGDRWRDLNLPVTIGANDLALSRDGDRLYASTGAGLYVLGFRRPETIAPRP